MLKLRNIEKTFYTETVETRALSDLNLEVQAGEFIAITGPSGCGKSTLLSIIGMLDTPTSGALIIDGTDVAGMPEKVLAKHRKKSIGFVFQSFNLIGDLTVRENIELALLYHTVSLEERKSRVLEVMETMGISHRAEHFPDQLSGGQQQRVAVARALVSRPKLILADEPTGNLDSRNGDEVLKMLQNLNANGSTVIMVTHSEAHAKIAHRNIRMLDGKILASVPELALV